jgi:PAS domain S-box-containing protein
MCEYPPSKPQAMTELEHLKAEVARLKAETLALTKQTAHLSLALEAAQMGIWDWNLLTNEITWAMGHEHLYGLPAGTFDGRLETFEACVHPDDRAALRQAQARAICEHSAYCPEYRVVWPDGSIHWMADKGRVFYNDRGQPVRLMGTVFDISDRKQAEAALQQSQRQYQTLTEASPVGIFRTDAAGLCIYVNDRWSKITQLSLANALGTGWANALHPDDRDRVFTAWAEAVATNQIFSAEYRFQSPMGTSVWVFGQAVAETDDRGILHGYVGTITDITDRKQTEDALRQSEAQFRVAFEQSPVGIALVDLNRQFLRLNPALCTLLGYPKAELMAKTFEEVTHPADLATDLALNDRLVRGELTFFQMEKRLICKAGDLIHVLLNAALVRDDQERPLQIIAQVVNITPLKQAKQSLESANAHLEQRVTERTVALTAANAQLQQELQERQKIEQALRNNQALLQAIVDNSPAVIYLADATHRILLANRQCATLVNLPQPQLLGQLLQDVLPAAVAEQHLALIKTVLATGQGISGEHTFNTPTGPRTYLFVKFPLFDATGVPYAVGGIGTEITERALIARMKDEFIAMISHELRTPLSAIHGALNLLTEGAVDPSSTWGKEMLRIASDGADRLVLLVNDILDLERLESGQIDLVIQPCQLADLMLKTTELMQVIADREGITIATTPCRIDCPVDADRLIQVLTNLLNNAIKFSPRGSTVWLTADRQVEAGHPYLLIKVQDQGRGIGPEQLEMIFDRFHQVDISDSRQKGGAGLGLPICRNIVEQHGGKIWAESGVGLGSCFYVKLPL